MQFLVCRKQHGEGCDYTIGCGMAFGVIDADSIEDAQEKIIYPEGLDEYSALEGDYALSELLIVPYDAVLDVELTSIAETIKDRNNQAEQNEKVKSDLAELDRLKAQYPDH
jgi:hypothetical protein